MVVRGVADRNTAKQVGILRKTEKVFKFSKLRTDPAVSLDVRGAISIAPAATVNFDILNQRSDVKLVSRFRDASLPTLLA